MVLLTSCASKTGAPCEAARVMNEGKALAQSGATPGGPGPPASQLPVLFLAYSSVSKTTPPAGGERGPAFFTFGLQFCGRNISLGGNFWLSSKGKPWGIESPLKPHLDGDCLTQILPFQKYAQSSKPRVSCRYGHDRVLGKTQQSGTAAALLRETSRLRVRPDSRGQAGCGG